jgi:excisionase family DNA binding protein
MVWRMQTHLTTIDTAQLERGHGSGRSPADATLPGSTAEAKRAPVTGRLLTADEVAVVLGVPRTFVYSLARRGELPTVRIGERYVRFRALALDRWISDQETTRPKGTQ